ncbi:MAG: adenine phosphoribosyltransferase [Candidatus Sumerlaeota bacterium]|nr:adenine phosphoribosyltransferase [Candidatus Sumerlaeota bacterium]
MDLLSRIRNVPDFPKPGIQFKDITTLLKDRKAFGATIDGMIDRYGNAGITKVVGVESRGFIFGSALAYALGLGFVPIRKAGKLPAATLKESYELEYGAAEIEIHTDAIEGRDKVLIVDDLLATGGTLEASARLIERAGGTVHEIWVLMELGFLPGREKLKNYAIHSEIVIPGE